MSHTEPQTIDLSASLRFTSSQKGYINHKTCFKQCIKNYTSHELDANQTQCIKQCLYNFNAVQDIVLMKTKSILEMELQQNPALAHAAQNH